MVEEKDAAEKAGGEDKSPDTQAKESVQVPPPTEVNLGYGAISSPEGLANQVFIPTELSPVITAAKELAGDSQEASSTAEAGSSDHDGDGNNEA